MAVYVDKETVIRFLMSYTADDDAYGRGMMDGLLIAINILKQMSGLNIAETNS